LSPKVSAHFKNIVVGILGGVHQFWCSCLKQKGLIMVISLVLVSKINIIKGRRGNVLNTLFFWQRL